MMGSNLDQLGGKKKLKLLYSILKFLVERDEYI